jgi:protoheme IX farnesyltransferase
MTQTARQIASLFKLRIGVAIMLSALAGIAVSPGPDLPAWKVVVLALAVMLSSASAGALNQYFERDLDARMARTRTRPFVTGEFEAGPLWLSAILLILAIAVLGAALATNLAAAFHVFMGAFVYGVVYTIWLKRRTWWNIVVGGLAGSFAVLAGASAVDPTLAPAPIILAVVLFLWTPPHFWSLAAALRKEYAEAQVPMLPVVVGNPRAAKIILAHTLALVALSAAPVFFGLGWIYAIGAAIGGALFVRASIAFVRRPTRKLAMANFKASLMQLGLLQLAAIADYLVLR